MDESAILEEKESKHLLVLWEKMGGLDSLSGNVYHVYANNHNKVALMEYICIHIPPSIRVAVNTLQERESRAD